MRAFISGRSYDSYGGGLPLVAAGDLLEEAAWRADCGVDHFEATAFLLNPGFAPSASRDAMSEAAFREEFEADRSRLPRIRWERSKRKLTLQYESHIATAPEMRVRHNWSRRLVLAAIDELAAFLNDQRPTLAKKAGLDEELFIRTVESLRADVPATDADVETFYNAHRQRVKDLEALLPWPERLEIDWKKFHPSARTLLDDELFWSESDEFSPHGNDTGHDLFDDLRRWRRSHAAASAAGLPCARAAQLGLRSYGAGRRDRHVHPRSGRHRSGIRTDQARRQLRSRDRRRRVGCDRPAAGPVAGRTVRLEAADAGYGCCLCEAPRRSRSNADGRGRLISAWALASTQ